MLRDGCGASGACHPIGAFLRALWPAAHVFWPPPPLDRTAAAQRHEQWRVHRARIAPRAGSLARALRLLARREQHCSGLRQWARRD